MQMSNVISLKAEFTELRVEKVEKNKKTTYIYNLHNGF